MFIACTICSREKDPSAESLPAKIRYRGSHILRVHNIAETENRQFFVLSGKFGLVSGDARIASYDHELKAEETDKLIRKVQSQLGFQSIKDVRYFGKMKSTWLLYTRVIETACKRAKVPYLFVALLDSA